MPNDSLTKPARVESTLPESEMPPFPGPLMPNALTGALPDILETSDTLSHQLHFADLPKNRRRETPQYFGSISDANAHEQ